MDIMDTLRAKARQKHRAILFPEAKEFGILAAARRALDEGIARPVLVGRADKVLSAARSYGVSLDGIDIIEPDINMCGQLASCLEPSGLAKFADMYITDPLYYGALMVHSGMADALVAGLKADTADVVMASKLIIGLREGIHTPSSFFLMEVPGFNGPEGNLIAFADCGVCEEPDENELADIAISTSDSVRALLGWEPRVAMLSYSTKGSAESSSVEKVANALENVQKLRPDILVDGELQLDAAIVPEVAKKKVKKASPVAGRANVLVFPDLDSGNICYKAVQRFAGANAYGPVLQGFAKTVSDLSRGSSVDDILGVITIAGAMDKE